MRTLVHLSDLHFGRVDQALLAPLVEAVRALAPDVVVVSGDLTQRARTAEFIQAKEFLARLPLPQIVVPGNHDVPLYNLVYRLWRPLERFRRHIEPLPSPSYTDQEIAVLGVNTARALVMKNGRINAAQVDALRETLLSMDKDIVKVVVTHHPFDVSADMAAHQRVGRADLAMAMFAQQGVDVLLAGHLHTSRSGGAGERYTFPGYEALVISAGTATSTRGRGEANSFNVLRLEKHRVAVDRFEWMPADRQFSCAERTVFGRETGRWRPIEATPLTT